MRIAVFGGSFNPPHVVHAMVASWLGWADQADEVWLVPVYRHAFSAASSGGVARHQKRLAPYDQRLAWVRALASDVGPHVRVSTIESQLPVPSYTIDTLRELARRHPQHDLRLVVGADVLGQVQHWRDWAGIQRDFSPIIVGRQGHPAPPDVASLDFPGVSSTDIRRRISQGQPVQHLLTRGVAALMSGDPFEVNE